MKITTKRVPEKKFIPITTTIVIETKEEYEALKNARYAADSIVVVSLKGQPKDIKPIKDLLCRIATLLQLV